MSKTNTQDNQSIFFIFKDIKQGNEQPPIEKRFKCTFKNCLKVYSHKNKMIAHLRTHFNIRPFQCNFCDKSFNERGNLKTHIRIHTGERPYHCNQCTKSFKAFGQLKDHLSSHIGLKPFQCPICKKFYRRKGILKNHVLIHSNKPKVLKRIRRKYICNQCSIKFPSQKKLKLHMLSHLDSIEKKSVTEEISTEISLSSSGNVKKEDTSNDDDYYHKNSICDEMFNMLQNDIKKKESHLFCGELLSERESCLGYDEVNFLGVFC